MRGRNSQRKDVEALLGVLAASELAIYDVRRDELMW